MKRAPKGSGSVTQLQTGKWLVKIPCGKSPDGKTRYMTKTCATKSVARQWQSALLAQREQHGLIAGPRQTFARYASEVLLNPNDEITERTRDGYFRNLRKHVFPVIGSRPLSEIRPQELEKLFSDIRRRRTASTVNNVRIAVSKTFSIALRHELVHSNPVKSTRKARRWDFEPTQVCPPLTREEVHQELTAARDTPMEAFITLAISTGMRRGELLGLRWSDIDFEHQTVSIERTIHHVSATQADGSRQRTLVIASPKSASSRRVNQLPEPVLDVLRRHQMEQDVAREVPGQVWQNLDYVFSNNQGGPLDESNFYKRYIRFEKKNGLRHVRIHDLRHTFATILIEEDAGQLASVSQALGHSSIRITMDVYAKTARIETLATSRMAEIMFPERGKVAPIEVPAPAKVGSHPRGYRRGN